MDHSSGQEKKKYATLRYDTVEVENQLNLRPFSTSAVWYRNVLESMRSLKMGFQI